MGYAEKLFYVSESRVVKSGGGGHIRWKIRYKKAHAGLKNRKSRTNFLNVLASRDEDGCTIM